MMGHTFGIKLSFEEAQCERKLDKLRTKMLEEDPCLLTADFDKKVAAIVKSDLF